MKFVLLSLFALILSAEAFSQTRVRRTPRGNTRVIVNPGYRPSYGPVRVVGPRYNPNPYSRRIIQTTRRYYTGSYQVLGYSCYYNQLTVAGRTVHNFVFSSDCEQAVSDIRYYGDFCDGSDLYDQSGAFEASFSFNYECRNALGYYY